MCNKAVKALLKRAEAKRFVPRSRLQLFAGDGSGGSDDDGGDPDDGDDDDGDDGSGDDSDDGDDKRLSFDDFLGQEGNQSEMG